MIECLLAEDQTLVRLGLKNLLELDGELVVTHCAENGAACIELLAQYQFDVVLLDMRMPSRGY